MGPQNIDNYTITPYMRRDQILLNYIPQKQLSNSGQKLYSKH